MVDSSSGYLWPLVLGVEWEISIGGDDATDVSELSSVTDDFGDKYLSLALVFRLSRSLALLVGLPLTSVENFYLFGCRFSSTSRGVKSLGVPIFPCRAERACSFRRRLLSA